MSATSGPAGSGPGPRPGSNPQPQQAARVLVLTRAGCHLCDDAIAIVEAVCAETGDSWATQDIDADPELRRRYTDEVPVTFVDGAQHDYWRVDPRRLRTALRPA